MATWIRQGTGTAPTATDADLTGDYALDNATAPVDFDPAAVSSVQCQWTIDGSGFVDDSWDNVAGVAVETGATEISQHPAEGSTGNQNVSRASDHTDSTGIPTGLSVADWEAALVRGDGTVIPDEWCLWVKSMGPDGSTLAVSALTVTITYTPASGDATPTPATVAATTTMPPAVVPLPDRVGFTANAAANSTSLVLTKPAGVEEGDVLVVFISDEDETSVHTAPDGSWTEITSGTLASASSSMSVWRKVAGPSEPADYTFAGGGGADLAGIIAAYRNRDVTTPVNASSFVADTGNTTPSTSVTTTVADCILVAMVMNDISSGKPPSDETYTSDDGMAKLHEDFGSGDLMHAAFDQLVSTATGYTRSFTYSSTETDHMIGLVALAPAEGSAFAEPAAIAAVVSVPQVTVTAGQAATATPAAIAATGVVPQASVPVGATATPAAAVLVVASPAVQAVGGATPTPAAVTSPVTLPAAAPQGSAAVSPAMVAGVVTVPAVQVDTSSPATVTPATIAGVVATPTPIVIAGVLVQPAAVAGSVALPTAVGSGEASVTPAAMVATIGQPLPTVTAGTSATGTAAVIPTVAAMQAVTIEAGATTVPAAIAAPAAMPAATALTGGATTATPAAANVTVAVPAPGVSAGSLVSVDTVAVTSAMQASTVSSGTSAITTPDTVDAPAAFGTPTTDTGNAATGTPNAVEVIASIPVSSVLADIQVRPDPVNVVVVVPQAEVLLVLPGSILRRVRLTGARITPVLAGARDTPVLTGARDTHRIDGEA